MIILKLNNKNIYMKSQYSQFSLSHIKKTNVKVFMSLFSCVFSQSHANRSAFPVCMYACWRTKINKLLCNLLLLLSSIFFELKLHVNSFSSFLFFQLECKFNIIIYSFQVYSLVVRSSYTLQSVPSIFPIPPWHHP